MSARPETNPVEPEILPIRRHAALVPLSREHHAALLLARGLRGGVSRHLRDRLPSEPAARAALVRAFFAEELADHFAAEEELLLPALLGVSAEVDEACARVLREHEQLGALVRRLGVADLPEEEASKLLEQFGELLEAHVRHEERVLFAAVQACLDDRALALLGERLRERSR